MAATERLICASGDLVDSGDGVRFEVKTKSGTQPAFVVRFEGQPRAFVNQCAHVPVELDWQEGAFFDADGRYLICATHGATYDPVSGACVFGPCRGAALKKLAVVETDGGVWLVGEND
ncbi:MAG TPA: Rieske 2Fe-2S domain-containing protein [Denitromonas sp.]|mgnify:CR=1 FL=1|uniref:Rieske (2Fe-2S) protein n=1 Tax=Denitromonas sp. TaxID=2734609 RepID=UPI001D9A5A08|nr:Rieske 2Fe-2S domain-containing protein [Rhodocyclaceae bacterium]MCP5220330.1 Rieske 2Fe-2S domain-containing protein [Zoogloeaceae bacterium]HPR06210.1 Rieske 2Fe-2S domain-containing protein [Denitromonas sp.]HQU88861.1 Rieske 2Fe-2S domain-containing protein [Denitromonas sp.]HQV13455.1 Rieske 2Fe-2S domain-containing protein [Denitromonas sp.]